MMDEPLRVSISTTRADGTRDVLWKGTEEEFVAASQRAERSAMKLLKVKHDKSGEITIVYEDEICEDTVTVTRTGKGPLLSFYAAFDSLVPHACKILELPDAYRDEITCTGISFAYSKDGVMGATMTLQKKLLRSAAPAILNTPYKPEWGDPNALSRDCLDAIRVVIAEAQRFLDGERAQTEMEE